MNSHGSEKISWGRWFFNIINPELDQALQRNIDATEVKIDQSERIEELLQDLSTKGFGHQQ